MKNKENTIVKVYTQADNKKVAISMLHTEHKGQFYERTKPTAAVEQFGNIEGEIVSYWGKLPVVLVSVEQFKDIKKEYELLEYRGPVQAVGGSGSRTKKIKPSTRDVEIYRAALTEYLRIYSGNVYSRTPEAVEVTPKDIANNINGKAYTLNLDNADICQNVEFCGYKCTAAFLVYAVVEFAKIAGEKVPPMVATPEPAEQPAAVADTPAPAVEVAEVAADAPALVQAAKETGHLIICSVPKATPAPEVAAPVEDIEAAVVAHFEDLAENAPADDSAADILHAGIETGKVIICSVPKAEPTTPTGEKTEPTPAPVKKRKELAEYHGAIVEVVEHRESDAIIKYKYGAGGLANYEDLKPTTAKKTALPEWLQSFCILETESGIFRLDAVGQKNMHYYRPDGFYYSSSVARFIDSYGHTVKNWHIDPEFAPEETEPDPDAIGEIVTIPAEQKTAPTDAEVMETAARIRANYEAMQADIDADKQRAADMFADAITAYCESIEPPAAPRWEPETIIIKPVFRDAEPAPAPMHRRRLRLPRLRPAFRRLLRVAAVVLPLLVFALLTASSQTAAPADAAPVAVSEAAPLVADAVADAVADTVVYCAGELPPVEVCAPRTPAGQKCCTPSRSKNAVAVADTPAGQKTASSCTPSGQKTAPAAVADAPQPDSQPHGLTICAGTAWQYTMMNWA